MNENLMDSRDPYVFNLFEVLLTTLETKLRRVENMDRALQHLAMRLDTFEGSLQHTLNTTTKVIHLIETRLLDPVPSCPPPTFYEYHHSPQPIGPHPPPFDPLVPLSQSHPKINAGNLFSKPATPQPLYHYEQNHQVASSPYRDDQQPPQQPQYHQFPSSFNTKQHQFNGSKGPTKSESDVEERLDVVAAHISKIDSKLSSLQQQLDTNSVTAAGGVGSGQDELVAAASESYRVDIGLGARRQALFKNQDLRNIESSLERVQDTLEELNQRFEQHAALNREQIEHMIDNMVQVRQAVVINGPVLVNGSLHNEGGSSSDGFAEPYSKLDVLVQKVSPLQEVRKKMDEVWSVLVGTKSSVDVLVPKSDALLTNSQRQERAILHIGTDLSEKTDRIIHNLGQGEPHKAGPNATTASTAAETNRTASVERGVHSMVLNMVQKKPVDSTFITPSVNDDTTGYSCSDLMQQGRTESGNYHIRIRGTTYWFLKVNCDMEIEGGGWTVIQRRDDFDEPRENFNRDWTDYKHGFGNPDKEFYLGNENIYLLTNTQEHVLRVELEDFEGNRRYAEYSTFKLHSELDLYKLEIGGYTGNAGNSLNDPWYGSNLSPFSTFDRDNDRSSLNCASMLKGGWWWRSCGRGLNGLYLTNPNDYIGRQGIVWFRWRGWDYSLKKSLIMIRPKSHTAKTKTKPKGQT